MACCSTKEKTYGGYDDSRFEKDVDENFHCSICYNVLKEPRMCKNNEHLFCLACITEHLRVNSQTCPECNDHLSVDTLRRPRVVNNCLSKLKINCDHASRGCPEFTCLEDLETHVVNCGYAPVLCSNAECGMVINKQDRVHHETAVCEYRRVKCYNCGQIQEDMVTLKGSLMKMDGKMEETNKRMLTMNFERKRVLEKLERNVMQLDEKVEAVQKKVKKKVKKEVKGVKESLSKVNRDVDEMKVMMIQMLGKEGMREGMREDILIAGGDNSGKSTEIFAWDKNGWCELSPLNEEHKGASSFIYNDQVYVIGGWDSKTVDSLDLNQLPLKWKKYHGELPDELACHQTVVYQQRVIRIGGTDVLISSDVISELEVTPLVTVEKLCKMPEPRFSHGAEIFEDKVVILGGEDNNCKVVNSVLKFDVKKNQCEEMPPLPHPLTKMANIRWRDQVIVLGGLDADGKALNNVFMYDCETGKTTALPSMLEKRCNCRAVITGNTIVVMGGQNEEQGWLKSVECFIMGGYTWEYLPDMNKARSQPVAEVLPCRRKYV